MLYLSAIAFPDIDPVIFSIGPVAVRWYGLGYVVGIVFAWWYAKRLLSNDRLWATGQKRWDPLLMDDFVFWAAIGVIAGGRLGYVLFYDLASVIADPLRLLRVWEGGMSFHGGLIGVTLAMIGFARRNGISIPGLFDVVAPGVPFALGAVRCTNFINGELWGRVSDLPWAVVFPFAGPEPRHPSQLYEAFLEGVVLFVVLRLATHRFKGLRRPGLVSGVFAAGYGLCRFAVEFFREPDVQLGYLAGGWLTMGMVLTIPMMLIGAALIIFARKRPVEGANAA
jgi:phosphatidylglycerol:prolipoprotein diacylglycerol transferase